MTNFYRESEVLSAFAAEVRHLADRDGFIYIDGERWGTPTAIARELGISRNTLLERVRHRLALPAFA